MTRMIQCISPVDGRVYAERPALSPEAAAAAVARATAAQPAWAALPLEERIARVTAGIAALGDEGPHRRGTGLADGPAHPLRRRVRRRERAHRPHGGHRRRGAGARWSRKARTASTAGSSASRTAWCFVIAPWNYPYLTAINTIVPALIAGNAVMLKHASQTILVGERLAEALHKGGVPEDIFQNVVLDHDGHRALIAARAFGFVNFTGSVAGGRRSSARRRAPSPPWGWSLAARTRAM
jgi:acyl-CoA reductase-like NAD-dependent aldehyde dehydrogenase